MKITIEPLAPEQMKPMPKELVFGKTFSNRMFSQRYTPALGWHDAVIGPYRPFSMDPAAAVLHYGQEIFEGLKAYRRPDGHINLQDVLNTGTRRASSSPASAETSPMSRSSKKSQITRG